MEVRPSRHWVCFVAAFVLFLNGTTAVFHRRGDVPSPKAFLDLLPRDVLSSEEQADLTSFIESYQSVGQQEQLEQTQPWGLPPGPSQPIPPSYPQQPQQQWGGQQQPQWGQPQQQPQQQWGQPQQQPQQQWGQPQQQPQQQWGQPQQQPQQQQWGGHPQQQQQQPQQLYQPQTSPPSAQPMNQQQWSGLHNDQVDLKQAAGANVCEMCIDVITDLRPIKHTCSDFAFPLNQECAWVRDELRKKTTTVTFLKAILPRHGQSMEICSQLLLCRNSHKQELPESGLKNKEEIQCEMCRMRVDEWPRWEGACRPLYSDSPGMMSPSIRVPWVNKDEAHAPLDTCFDFYNCLRLDHPNVASRVFEWQKKYTPVQICVWLDMCNRITNRNSSTAQYPSVSNNLRMPSHW